ncbi:MAG TPA: hypothetical protein VGI11_20330 [Variovorax sp.]
MSTRPATSQTVEYRGTSIRINVAGKPGDLYGHADLFSRDEFKGRLALGNASCEPAALQRKLRLLAKFASASQIIAEPRGEFETAAAYDDDLMSLSTGRPSEFRCRALVVP